MTNPYVGDEETGGEEHLTDEPHLLHLSKEQLLCLHLKQETGTLLAIEQ